MKKKIIEIKHLSKKIGKDILIDDITFDLEENEILSIVGDNDIGLISKSILKLIEYDGKIKIYNNEPFLYSMNFIGYFSNSLDLYKNMKIKDFVNLSNSFYKPSHKSNYLDLLNRYNLDINRKIADLGIEEYTTLKLIDSFFFNPSILILDHPFKNLNKDLILKFKEDFLTLKKNGSSILLLTDSLSNLKGFTNRLIVFKNKKIKEIDIVNNDINTIDIDSIVMEVSK